MFMCPFSTALGSWHNKPRALPSHLISELSAFHCALKVCHIKCSFPFCFLWWMCPSNKKVLVLQHWWHVKSFHALAASVQFVVQSKESAARGPSCLLCWWPWPGSSQGLAVPDRRARCASAQFYLWTLKFEFHIIFRHHEVVFWLPPSQPLKNRPHGNRQWAGFGLQAILGGPLVQNI